MTAAQLKLDQGKGLEDLALSTHGVNNGQALKAAPVWSMVSGSDWTGVDFSKCWMHWTNIMAFPTACSRAMSI